MFETRNAITKLAAFAAALAVLFVVATLAGAAIDPEVAADGHDAGPATHTEHDGESAPLPGLAVAEARYQLVPQETVFGASRHAAIGFRIEDEGGQTLSDFDVEHARRMHLIVVRRDFADFQHLHPTQLADGSWRARAELSQAGVYRVFADFSTGGRSLTLATDIFVGGDYEPKPLPAPSSTADAGDGYEVELHSDQPQAAAATPVSFTVTRHGQPINGVEPYLGADGHLVALREHDQAFLHVHPEGEPGGTGPIRFQVEYPRLGRFRLYLQFKHQGEIHTAAFTQVTTNAHDDGH